MEDVSTFYIDYGKYRYYYSEDVFIGCENPTQEFIEFYFKSCFDKLSFYEFSQGIDNKAQYSLHVTSFKLLPNNQIVIELNSSEIKQSSSYVSDLNIALMKSESFPDKNIFGSVNELILEENKKREEYNVHSGAM